ncbi:MAG: DUF4391 domain-containing protein [Ruminococcaceae bacterium]|nr:DUF4391 domain-containing protein [Oscillospiraceae bacterium]
MLSLPEKYKKDNRIAVKPFLTPTLSAAEKKRFKDAVEEIRITYQIEGFDIPNLVNEEYNCQVIAFLSVRLKDLKSAAFAGRVIQSAVKTLCVIEFTDGIDECWCFADKRLNKQDNNEIVVESVFLTEKMPLNFDNDTKTLFKLYIDHGSVLNRSNKHAYYMEMMTKAFIVFNQTLYSGCMKILDSKLWYSENNVIRCYSLLMQLKAMKSAALKLTSIADKGATNRQMKEVISQLADMLEGSGENNE